MDDWNKSNHDGNKCSRHEPNIIYEMDGEYKR